MSILKKTIISALALSAATIAWAGKTVEVKFPNGVTEATYRGSVRGDDFDRYTFYARKGQILNIDVSGSDINIMPSVRYLGKTDTMLETENQVLPYSGRYEIRVLQTRNGARKSSAARPYHVNIAIHNAPNTPAATATKTDNTTFENHPANTKTIHFARGKNSASYTGKIRGYNYDSYRLTANAGQTLKVAASGSPYLVITISKVDTNGQLEPIPEAPVLSENQITLPESGEYDIRVGQMRAGARANTTRNYRLTVGVFGK